MILQIQQHMIMHLIMEEILYESISDIVDEIFSTYVRRFGRKQPLLTQYCDGKSVDCPEWLSQWGSKYLGDQGKVPYEILTIIMEMILNL